MSNRAESQQPKRVHMLVWNSFVHDARVRNEAITLIQAGYNVCVHALHLPGVTPVHEVTADGIEVVRYGKKQVLKQAKKKSQTGVIARPLNILMQILSRLGTHAQILWALVRAKPNVIHAHDVDMLSTAWLASVFSRCALVYDAHEIGTGREGYAGLRKIVGCIEQFLMPKAQGLITTTDMRAKFFSRVYGVKRPLVLQNRPRLQKQLLASNTIRETLKLDEPWPIVIYQGGLQAGRGLELLLRTAAETKDAYYVFVGSGVLLDTLQNIVKELQLEKRIHFIPAVPLEDLPSYTASADIGIQPILNTCLNHYTTDSNKLFEYVQAGLPIITSNLPEIRKVVQAYDLGLLVEEDNQPALIEALNTLIQGESLRNYYAEKSSRAALSLNWENQEQELVSLYASIVK